MRHIFITICSAALVVVTAAPAAAGGSHLEPNMERVEAGDELELSGAVTKGELGWTEDGPFFAYLAGENYGSVITEGSGGAETDVLLGELMISVSGNRAQVSVMISVPGDAPPGEYQVTSCNDPCTTGFGDLDGATIFVGIDPPKGVGQVAVATTVHNSTTSTTTNDTAVTVIEPTAPTSVATAAAHLMLAPHPTRSTNLAPTWIAVSAGLAAVVLLLILFTRRPENQ